MQFPRVQKCADTILSVFSNGLQTYVGYYKNGGYPPEKGTLDFIASIFQVQKKMVIKKRIDTVHAYLHIGRSRLPRKYDMIKSSNQTNNKRETNTNPFEINPTQTRYHLHSKLHPLHLLLQNIYMHH